jgi:hypothetical protein
MHAHHEASAEAAHTLRAADRHRVRRPNAPCDLRPAPRATRAASIGGPAGGTLGSLRHMGRNIGPGHDRREDGEERRV